MELPTDILSESIITPTEYNERHFHWFITYELANEPNEEVLAKIPAIVQKELFLLPDLLCYVFQLIKYPTSQVYITITFSVTTEECDPKRYLSRSFPLSCFYVVKDVEEVRKFCCRPKDRFSGPHVFNLKTEELKFSPKANIVVRKSKERGIKNEELKFSPEANVALTNSKERDSNYAFNLKFSPEANLALTNSKEKGIISEREIQRTQSDRILTACANSNIHKIYLIRAGDSHFYKIGSSYNLEEYLPRLQKTHPEVLKVITLCIGNKCIATFLCRKFAKRRMTNDWFTFTESEMHEAIIMFMKLDAARMKISTAFKEGEGLYERLLVDFGLILYKKFNKLGDLPIDTDVVSYLRLIRENLGEVMGKTKRKKSMKYPECPGKKCWCCSCALKTTEPDDYFEETYNEEEHKREAEEWAEDLRSKWGWFIEAAFSTQEIKTPTFEIEEINSDYEVTSGTGIEPEIAPKKEVKYAVKIVAEWISSKVLVIKCPFCWTEYSINGEPYKGAKQIHHRYEINNININDDFKCCRLPQCESYRFQNRRRFSQWNFPLNRCSSFVVYVTDATQRKFLLNNKKKESCS